VFQALKARFDRWQAIRELRSAEIRHGSDFRPHFVIKTDIAVRALQQGDRALAVEIWRQMRAQFPGVSAVSEGALGLALELGYYDEAEAMLKEGPKYRPEREAFCLTGLARVAYRRGDLEEAVRRCSTVLRSFPTEPHGYHIAATCLAELGRHEEADAVLARGMASLPTDFEMNRRYAQLAKQRRAWPEALRRWELMQSRFKDIAGPVGSAEALREMGRLAEAEEVLTEASKRYDESNRLIAEWANLATAKGDLTAAIEYWAKAVRLFPSFAMAYTRGAKAMRELGQETEADELLCLAVKRIKTNLALHLEYARSAHRRHDWAAAAERWRLVRDRFPDCVEAQQQEMKALTAAERHSRHDAGHGARGT
jgi:tetratricopeptide (TPR) repeat protein